MNSAKIICLLASIFCTACSTKSATTSEMKDIQNTVYVQYKQGYFFEKFVKGPEATVEQDYVTCYVLPKKIDGVRPERWIYKDGNLIASSDLEDYSIVELHCEIIEQNFPSFYVACEAIYRGVGEEVSDSNIYNVKKELGV